MRSFMLYLLERSTKEEFMYAYRNEHGMEEVFGKDINGMLDEWYEWLGTRD